MALTTRIVQTPVVSGRDVVWPVVRLMAPLLVLVIGIHVLGSRLDPPGAMLLGLLDLLVYVLAGYESRRRGGSVGKAAAAAWLTGALSTVLSMGASFIGLLPVNWGSVSTPDALSMVFGVVVLPFALMLMAVVTVPFGLVGYWLAKFAGPRSNPLTA